MNRKKEKKEKREERKKGMEKEEEKIEKMIKVVKGIIKEQIREMKRGGEEISGRITRKRGEERREIISLEGETSSYEEEIEIGEIIKRVFEVRKLEEEYFGLEKRYEAQTDE
ncbi:hypothetical protein ENUP19_0013G0047 [Entamoeba nuttalli]|uniref:Uncharacterized protein n=2 Tax=Entamoeba nuttalli TaxID=412467 RepID=K2GEQ1_ENTNP|nr:hypothetical protein ENU1_068710 [Entamoeba nuttalli P19]EKE41086.1 hypothetical protein ENU1_068710 [Entamoeba nuttalli P19]|eukprot:XP_008856593.1 hypothetical protein ENU1_068710 [Entamoeba nuttalli P19]